MRLRNIKALLYGLAIMLHTNVFATDPDYVCNVIYDHHSPNSEQYLLDNSYVTIYNHYLTVHANQHPTSTIWHYDGTKCTKEPYAIKALKEDRQTFIDGIVDYNKFQIRLQENLQASTSHAQVSDEQYNALGLNEQMMSNIGKAAQAVTKLQTHYANPEELEKTTEKINQFLQQAADAGSELEGIKVNNQLTGLILRDLEEMKQLYALDGLVSTQLALLVSGAVDQATKKESECDPADPDCEPPCPPGSLDCNNTPGQCPDGSTSIYCMNGQCLNDSTRPDCKPTGNDAECIANPSLSKCQEACAQDPSLSYCGSGTNQECVANPSLPQCLAACAANPSLSYCTSGEDPQCVVNPSLPQCLAACAANPSLSYCTGGEDAECIANPSLPQCLAACVINPSLSYCTGGEDAACVANPSLPQCLAACAINPSLSYCTSGEDPACIANPSLPQCIAACISNPALSFCGGNTQSHCDVNDPTCEPVCPPGSLDCNSTPGECPDGSYSIYCINGLCVNSSTRPDCQPESSDTSNGSTIAGGNIGSSSFSSSNVGGSGFANGSQAGASSNEAAGASAGQNQLGYSSLNAAVGGNANAGQSNGGVSGSASGRGTGGADPEDKLDKKTLLKQIAKNMQSGVYGIVDACYNYDVLYFCGCHYNKCSDKVKVSDCYKQYNATCDVVIAGGW